jgi:hypothetical protein
MTDSRAVAEFPRGQTLAGGQYRVTEHRAGHGDWELYLGARPDRPGERYLVSVVRAPNLEVEPLRARLSYQVPGVFELVHIGHFDVTDGGADLGTMQRGYVGMVERLPDGDWMPRWTTTSLGALVAVELGLAVGRTLVAAARADQLLVAVRPHTIWAIEGDGHPIVTGLSGRTGPFFAQRAKSSMVSRPAFERHYAAPEVYLGRDSREESLVFTLAVMVAEWATGAYPFPKALAGGNMSSLTTGRHAALEVPIRLAGILAHALEPDPADRPSLGRFLERLSSLDPSDLTA